MVEENSKLKSIQDDIQSASDIPVIPTNKLDADQYAADDSDGVTESLFGSGNIGYASLQASQTDAALDLQDLVEANNTDTSSSSGFSPGGNANHSNLDNSPSNASHATTGSVATSQLSSDEGSFAAPSSGLKLSDSLSFGDASQDGSSRDTNKQAGLNVNPNETPNAPSQSEPTPNPKVEVINEHHTSGQDGDNIIQGDTIIHEPLTEIVNETMNLVETNITNLIQEVTNITNVVESVINVDVTEVTQDIIDISHTLNESLQTTTESITNIFETAGDTLKTTENTSQEIIDSLQTNISSMTEVKTVQEAIVVFEDTVANLQTTLQQYAEQTVNNSESLLVEIQEMTDVILNSSQTLVSLVENQVEQIFVHITNGGPDNLQNDLDLSGSDNPDGDVGIDVNMAGPIGEAIEEITDDDFDQNADTITNEVAIDPVEDLAGDVDTHLDISMDPLGFDESKTDNSAGDEDVTTTIDGDVVDQSVVNANTEVSADPLEEVVGDVDVSMEAATDVLDESADDVLDDGAGGSTDESVTADLGNAVSYESEEIVDATIGDTQIDTDITLDALETDESTSNSHDDSSDVETNVEVSIGDTEVITDTPVETNVDPIEAIIGDIDVETDAAIELLSETVNDDSAEDNGIESQSSWTENLASEGEGMFDDIINEADGSAAGLPEPGGSVGEGLNELDVEPELDVTSAGGLF